MSKGYVYALSNEAMPGLIKIGRTCRSVQRRAHELYQTGVPTPFKVVVEVLSPDCVDLERRLHLELADKRLSESREFFSMSEDEARQHVVDHHREQVEDLVHEFLPDQFLVPVDDYVCGAAAGYAARYIGCSISDVSLVLEHFSEDEVRAAAERAIEKRPDWASRFPSLKVMQ